jgi:hypothetical protein
LTLEGKVDQAVLGYKDLKKQLLGIEKQLSGDSPLDAQNPDVQLGLALLNKEIGKYKAELDALQGDATSDADQAARIGNIETHLAQLQKTLDRLTHGDPPGTERLAEPRAELPGDIDQDFDQFFAPDPGKDGKADRGQTAEGDHAHSADKPDAGADSFLGELYKGAQAGLDGVLSYISDAFGTLTGTPDNHAADPPAPPSVTIADGDHGGGSPVSGTSTSGGTRGTATATASTSTGGGPTATVSSTTGGVASTSATTGGAPTPPNSEKVAVQSSSTSGSVPPAGGDAPTTGGTNSGTSGGPASDSLTSTTGTSTGATTGGPIADSVAGTSGVSSGGTSGVSIPPPMAGPSFADGWSGSTPSTSSSSSSSSGGWVTSGPLNDPWDTASGNTSSNSSSGGSPTIPAGSPSPSASSGGPSRNLASADADDSSAPVTRTRTSSGHRSVTADTSGGHPARDTVDGPPEPQTVPNPVVAANPPPVTVVNPPATPPSNDDPATFNTDFWGSSVPAIQAPQPAVPAAPARNAPLAAQIQNAVVAQSMASATNPTAVAGQPSRSSLAAIASDPLSFVSADSVSIRGPGAEPVTAALNNSLYAPGPVEPNPSLFLPSAYQPLELGNNLLAGLPPLSPTVEAKSAAEKKARVFSPSPITAPVLDELDDEPLPKTSRVAALASKNGPSARADRASTIVEATAAPETERKVTSLQTSGGTVPPSEKGAPNGGNRRLLESAVVDQVVSPSAAAYNASEILDRLRAPASKAESLALLSSIQETKKAQREVSAWKAGTSDLSAMIAAGEENDSPAEAKPEAKAAPHGTSGHKRGGAKGPAEHGSAPARDHDGVATL